MGRYSSFVLLAYKCSLDATQASRVFLTFALFVLLTVDFLSRCANFQGRSESSDEVSVLPLAPIFVDWMGSGGELVGFGRSMRDFGDA